MSNLKHNRVNVLQISIIFNVTKKNLFKQRKQLIYNDEDHWGKNSSENQN